LFMLNLLVLHETILHETYAAKGNSETPFYLVTSS
jgi:hypothetical protein